MCVDPTERSGKFWGEATLAIDWGALSFWIKAHHSLFLTEAFGRVHCY